MTTAPVRSDVAAAIARVVDPCSAAMGMPLDLAEMGLVADVVADRAARRVEVTLCLTAPCCTYGPTMTAALERELADLEWVDDAVVEIDHTVVWSPDRMSDTARARRVDRLARTRRLLDVRPFDWSADRAQAVPKNSSQAYWS